MKIAILGSTGHIGRALAHEFSKTDMVHMFDRTNIEYMNHDLYNITINCIGVGTPKRTAAEQDMLAEVNDRYDRAEFMGEMHVYISSGIVYPQFRGPEPTPYEIVKLYTELKHRAMGEWIIDFRVFGFLSEFIDLDSGYLFTDMIKAFKEQKMITIPAGLQRCYWGAKDLADAIRFMYEKGPANTVFDCINAPISSPQMEEYFPGLKCKYSQDEFPRREYVIDNPIMHGFVPSQTAEDVFVETLNKLL